MTEAKGTYPEYEYIETGTEKIFESDCPRCGLVVCEDLKRDKLNGLMHPVRCSNCEWIGFSRLLEDALKESEDMHY